MTRVVAATVEPVTLADVKDHLRVEGSDDDARLAALISAETQKIDGWYGTLGRAIVTQTWDLKLDCFPHKIWVPLPPLQSVTSISYIDLDGATQTLATSVYKVVNNGDGQSFIEEDYQQDWPSTKDVREAVTVRFVCGYPGDGGSPEDLRANIPDGIIMGLKFGVSMMFDTCDEVMARSFGGAKNALLAPYKVVNQYPL